MTIGTPRWACILLLALVVAGGLLLSACSATQPEACTEVRCGAAMMLGVQSGDSPDLEPAADLDQPPHSPFTSR